MGETGGLAPDRYQWLSFNAPLSSWRADRLAADLAGSRPRQVLDLGCGWGELLLRVLAAAPEAVGTGVDQDADLLARARRNAASRGLDHRVTWVTGAAQETHEVADTVLCVGASHAFGGAAQALRGLHPLVCPGGRLLFGEGFWKRPPTSSQAAALGTTPDGLTDLPGLVDLAWSAGFRPVSIASANRDEWEEFESGYLAHWEHALLRLGDGPETKVLRQRSDQHRTSWLRGYRNVLGFAYLTLGVPVAKPRATG